MSKLTFDKGVTIIGYLSVLAIVAILGYAGYMEFVYDPMSPVFRMIDKLDKEEVYQTEKFLLTNNKEVLLEYLKRVELTQFEKDDESRYTIQFEKDDLIVIHLEGEGVYLLVYTEGLVRLKIPKKTLRVKDEVGGLQYIKIPKTEQMYIVVGSKEKEPFKEMLETINFSEKQKGLTLIQINNYIELAYEKRNSISD